MRRTICTAIVIAALGFSHTAYAADRDCVTDKDTGKTVCRDVPDPVSTTTVTVVGVGLVIGATFLVLWATRPARSRRGPRLRRAEAPAPPPVDAWVSEDGGGLKVQWAW